MSPYLPVTPDQITEASIAAAKAGAAIVHLHARNPKTGKPDHSPAAFSAFLPRIKQAADVVVNLTSGGARYMGIEERIQPAIMFYAGTSYVPMEGGGGTQPWAGIAEILKKPEYKDADGYLMLTDGAFAHPPDKLIVPSKWCFLMTSEYSKGAIPAGCTILETFVEDPNYIKAQSAKGKPKDIFKRAVISTGR
jgi:hypothetical protein